MFRRLINKKQGSVVVKNGENRLSDAAKHYRKTLRDYSAHHKPPLVSEPLNVHSEWKQNPALPPTKAQEGDIFGTPAMVTRHGPNNSQHHEYANSQVLESPWRGKSDDPVGQGTLTQGFTIYHHLTSALLISKELFSL